jgi:O-antigen biosynthesis protein
VRRDDVHASADIDAAEADATEVDGSATVRGPRVHVIMATHEPRADHFAAQLASILAQQDVDLDVHVVDDGSTAASRRTIALTIGDDPRVRLSTFDRVGVLRSIERALHLVPADAEVVLLADQDDVWRPDKAVRLAAGIASGHLLVHSDATVVDDAGDVIAASLFAFEGRDVDAVDVESLVVRNVVTGCTAALAPRLLPHALPFPDRADGRFHHDLWLALVAASIGTIGVDRAPLVAYRQHADNVVGAVAGYGRWPGPAAAIGAWTLRRDVARALVEAAEAGRIPAPPRLVRAWAGRFGEPASLVLVAADAIDRPGSRALDATLAAGAIGSLLRRARALPGLAAAVWRRARLVGRVTLHAARHPRASVGLVARSAGITLDGPERVISGDRHGPEQRAIAARLGGRPGRIVHVLVPGVSPSGVFGGVATAVTLAVGLAERGERVRIVLTDYGQTLGPARVRALVLRHVRTSPATLDRIEVALAIRDDQVLDLGPADVFVATAWWTAFRAAATIEAQPGLTVRRAVYLVQDFEPLFYAESERRTMARASYALPTVPVVNSAPLAAHLADEVGLAVEPALVLAPIVAVPGRSPLRAWPTGGEPLRVVVYARPSVERNLFPTAMRAVARWLEQRTDDTPVEVVAVGERLDARYVVAGREVRDLGVRSWDGYLEVLAGAHLGVSLMLSPHPSYPPLEMATAGMVVVTNRWGPKDLATVSDRFVTCEPDVDGVADALAEAERRLAAGGDPPIALDRLGRDLDAVLDALVVRLDRGLPAPRRPRRPRPPAGEAA